MNRTGLLAWLGAVAPRSDPSCLQQAVTVHSGYTVHKTPRAAFSNSRLDTLVGKCKDHALSRSFTVSTQRGYYLQVSPNNLVSLPAAPTSIRLQLRGTWIGCPSIVSDTSVSFNTQIRGERRWGRWRRKGKVIFLRATLVAGRLQESIPASATACIPPRPSVCNAW